MRIKQIDLDETEVPSHVTVRMTIHEAALIAQAVGRMNDPAADELIVNGSQVYGEIFESFTGSLFNCYWHGGLEEAITLLPEP